MYFIDRLSKQMLIVDFIRILNYWVVEGIFVELIK